MSDIQATFQQKAVCICPVFHFVNILTHFFRFVNNENVISVYIYRYMSTHSEEFFKKAPYLFVIEQERINKKTDRRGK